MEIFMLVLLYLIGGFALFDAFASIAAGITVKTLAESIIGVLCIGFCGIIHAVIEIGNKIKSKKAAESEQKLEKKQASN